MPGNGEGRGHLNPGLTPTTTATNGTVIVLDASDRHCDRCRCRCDCHRPPPEPPVVYTPPQPGSWEWSGYLAGLSADLGSLAAAYGAIEEGRAA